MKYTKKNYIRLLTKNLEHNPEWCKKVSNRINSMSAAQVKKEMTILYGKEK